MAAHNLLCGIKKKHLSWEGEESSTTILSQHLVSVIIDWYAASSMDNVSM